MKKWSPPVARKRSEAGVTLVELLVVMGLLTLIGTITTVSIVTALGSARVANERVEATQELEIAGQRVIRELRAAEQIILPADLEVGVDPTPYESRISVRGQRDGSQFLTVFEVVVGEAPLTTAQLFATSTPVLPGTVDPIEGESSEQILVTVVDLGDEPVFRYLDVRGNDLAESCGSSCATTFAGADRVEIVLRRELRGDRAPIIVRSSASLRNVRFDR